MDDSQERTTLGRGSREEFLRHLAVFAAIAAGLWVVYALVTEDWTRTPWPIWPTLGMGVAVVIDAWKTFGPGPRP